jgi:hypothetical protein
MQLCPPERLRLLAAMRRRLAQRFPDQAEATIVGVEDSSGH